MVRVLVVLVALTRLASAGLDCDNEQAMRTIEKYAKTKAKYLDEKGEYAWLCADFAAKQLAKRVEAACTKILDRGGDPQCIDLAALAGFTKLGNHDIFATIAARRENPLDYPGGFFWPRLTYFGGMRDPRAAPLIVDTWRATIAKAAKPKADHTSWVMWRRDAAGVLGEVGGADEATFLDEQAKATKDKVVIRACQSAIKAIQARTKTP